MSCSTIPMNIIAAVDKSFGIGKNNSLPWKLPKEFKHFINLTTKTKNPNKINAVLMGRKCWESIPENFRPLKNRINIVMSKTIKQDFINERLLFINNLNTLFLILESKPYKDWIETIWNVGGRQIYSLGIDYPYLNKIVLTKIDKDFDCDIKFPEIDWNQFIEENNTEIVEEKGLCWQSITYIKKL
ncbi:hypothetical protein ACQ4LE_007818 [Meloidogyne hapla]|uniref:dihydrofolate reductase n=1 Tax=Meloidogyne hapla TaxID=6305 RepID=A0A1I8B814_MELHA